LLDDLRALVEFAHAGSIAGAADRLFRTPPAVTRQVQRLETALGAELLGRSMMQASPTSVCSTLEHVAAWARDGVDQEKAVRILSNESVFAWCR
jgi:DNA-binding transcriptional LysR family regulator